ncbi:MAG TPA: hypothetical protein VM659_21225 [Dongiaceae bacterium]|nr:hypothetical protein [Dongiaceae bacterium]
MARHLIDAFFRSALSRGKTVQQLLSAETVDGKWKIKWIEMFADDEGYHLYVHDEEKSIFGGFSDISEWSEPDDPKTFSSLDDAVRYVQDLGGSADRFVNHGLIDDEARDALGPDL